MAHIDIVLICEGNGGDHANVEINVNKPDKTQIITLKMVLITDETVIIEHLYDNGNSCQCDDDDHMWSLY